MSLDCYAGPPLPKEPMAATTLRTATVYINGVEMPMPVYTSNRTSWNASFTFEEAPTDTNFVTFTLEEK